MNESPKIEFRRQLRSLFAVLRAIVRRSAEGEHSKGDYAALLEGRISMLARVHETLLRAPDAGADLTELVHAEMLAQSVPAGRYRVVGPDTRIGKEAAMPIALALHELAVNALIHGAFAGPAGELDVNWAYVDRGGEPWLRFWWHETGVTVRDNPRARKGSGLQLLEHVLSYELDAKTRVAWSATGVHIELLIPGGASAVFWRPADQAIAV